MCGSTPSTAPEAARASTPLVHVMAAAIVDELGQVLVARRADDAHQGGLWEFPGGKLEPGEDRYQGLRRELDEELGIELVHARPLLRVRHDYPDRAVLLDVWRVDAFRGRPHGREGQPLQWLAPQALTGLAMPAADRPIVNAVRLPDQYLISGDFRDQTEFDRRLQTALAGGVRLVQLRAKHLPERDYLTLAQSTLATCRAHGAALLLNAPPEWVLKAGADGVHLSAERLLQSTGRPVPEDLWVAASCHNERELRHAEAIGADFAVLAPVQATASHPGAEPLGWARARDLLDRVAIPVYLLGGVGADELSRAWDCGAQGVAGIRAFWGEAQ